MDYINSLPQPFNVSLMGDKDTWWPLHDIEVGTGMLRIDVCGLLDVMHISDISCFRDSHGVKHDPDDFYKEQN